MKQILIVGNWKMHLNVHDSSILVKRLSDNIRIYRDIEVVLAPPSLSLYSVSQEIDRRKFHLAAQNAYFKDEGAFTGEISFTMLRDMVEYALVGHSERRIYFEEELPTIRDKVTSAIRNGIKPVLCIGETKQEKDNGETKKVIHDQLTTALANLTAEDLENVVIAYEPVWAISTFQGTIATPDQIKPIIDLIRFNVSELYGNKSAENLKVIYGGSVDDQTAAGYLAIEGVNGLLPGSASLNYKKFTGIVEAAHNHLHKQD
jgi:triosephosphate isomerase